MRLSRLFRMVVSSMNKNSCIVSLSSLGWVKLGWGFGVVS